MNNNLTQPLGSSINLLKNNIGQFCYNSRSSIIILFIILFAIFVRCNAGPRTIDDSYITYRYARNILTGNGFVYNSGEHVLGTTTPLYTMLLTTIAIPFGGAKADFPCISLIINSLFDGLTCYFLYLLGRRLNSQKVGFATALAWAIAPYSVTFAIGGLETSLYVFLLVFTSYYYVKDKYTVSGFIAALAFLTRPDALILILPLFIDLFLTTLFIKNHSIESKSLFIELNGNSSFKSLFHMMVFFSIPVLIWLAFATFYFGNPIPHSMVAKTLAYHLPNNAAFIRLLQHYATPFLEENLLHSAAILLGLFVYPFLAVIGSLKINRSSSRARPLLLFPWLYFLIFSIANPLIFRWYLTPPLCIYFLIIFAGLEALIEQIGAEIKKHTIKNFNVLISIPTFIFLFLLPTGFITCAWTMHPDHGIDKPAPKMAWYKLELLYKQVADFITNQVPSSESTLIAAGDVGVLGYYTKSRILDTVGLNSTQTINYYPLDERYYVINYAIPPKLITDYRPDYVVFLEVYGRKSLLQDQDFLTSYSLLKEFDTDIYGSQGMLIYGRNP